MHLYLRLLNAAKPENYSSQEEADLRTLLASAPGVEALKTVQRHPKGGYAATLEVEKEASELLMEYLSARALRPVW